MVGKKEQRKKPFSESYKILVKSRLFVCRTGGRSKGKGNHRDMGKPGPEKRFFLEGSIIGQPAHTACLIH